MSLRGLSERCLNPINLKRRRGEIKKGTRCLSGRCFTACRQSDSSGQLWIQDRSRLFSPTCGNGLFRASAAGGSTCRKTLHFCCMQRRKGCFCPDFSQESEARHIIYRACVWVVRCSATNATFPTPWLLASQKSVPRCTSPRFQLPSCWGTETGSSATV